MTTHHRHTHRTTVAALFVATGLGLTGCGTEGPETGTDVEDVTEGEVMESSPAPENNPTAGDTMIGNYDQDFYDERETYVDQEVTLSAEVNDVLDDDAFVIAGTAETTVDPLLVLYNLDQVDIEEGQVVEVTGTVQRAFDLPTIEDDTQKDLEDDLYQDYDQQPYLQATDVQLIPDE